ncbi:TetR/AcrR family transcriptional regulator [Streptomyces marispadix]|uniref:TetR/AcrR family transcriptional regulator n=1 Tax=Streptomyces marispadix TaxID=2922868 RepID=A0ABS9SUQ4_9ACTN|nr:TetR/AcrR family transcriptional regulator [Streptomyces marispadix]MCH6160021.1 TetR/AcrR family transcriptional regulator [Streptomyces marispadix]
MPKIVDAGERRRAVAEAVFTVVERQGVEGASLRNVADEAGLAIGSVRHYFRDHSEVLLFAMEEMSRRFEQRVLARVERLAGCTDRGERRAGTEALLEEFLPLDRTRRQEAAVWYAFVTAARTRPELRSRAEEVLEGMREVMARVLRGGQRTGALPERLDVRLESVRLAALLDGLTVQAVQAPGLLPPKLLRDVLRRHLDALSVAESG